jgi:putative FmdB family regulatory protein
MPLYEYQCDACGNRFERIQKFSDPPVEACPACGGTVKKILSSPAIQFKGSGWYITDYAKKGSGDRGKPAADGTAKSGAGDSGDKAPAAAGSSSPPSGSGSGGSTSGSGS